MLPPLCHPGDLVDVDNFVGDQFFPLVERGDGHGGILGVGAVDGRRLLAEVLLGASLGVIRLARAFGPAVAIGVERDALDVQALAALLELWPGRSTAQYKGGGTAAPWMGAP